MLTRRTFIIVAVGLAGCTGGAGNAPASLPSGVTIVPPGPDVPPALAAYSGKWHGVWTSGLDMILVVQEIVPPHVSIVFAYGSGFWNLAGSARVEGEINGSGISVARPSGGRFHWQMRADGSLSGSIIRQDISRPSVGHFVREP